MNRRTFAATALGAAAAGLTGLATVRPAAAELPPMMRKKLDEMLKQHPDADKKVIMTNMRRVQTQHLVRCYGINAVGRNDCASGAHACAGQATMTRDPNAFVLVPQGDCQKIAGGSLKPGKAWPVTANMRNRCARPRVRRRGRRPVPALSERPCTDGWFRGVPTRLTRRAG